MEEEEMRKKYLGTWVLVLQLIFLVFFGKASALPPAVYPVPLGEDITIADMNLNVAAISLACDYAQTEVAEYSSLWNSAHTLISGSYYGPCGDILYKCGVEAASGIQLNVVGEEGQSGTAEITIDFSSNGAIADFVKGFAKVDLWLHVATEENLWIVYETLHELFCIADGEYITSCQDQFEVNDESKTFLVTLEAGKTYLIYLDLVSSYGVFCGMSQASCDATIDSIKIDFLGSPPPPPPPPPQQLSILHRDGAIWSSDTGWVVSTPPYYPGTGYARALALVGAGYKILHRDGAIYDSVSGWVTSTPPYHPGTDYAVDLKVTGSGETIILHQDGALWSSSGGWTLTAPPYYPGTAYAKALEVRTDNSYVILHRDGAIYDSASGWVMTSPPYYPSTAYAVDMKLEEGGYVILHRDGAVWSTSGGWIMTSPPYYPTTDYARALVLVGDGYKILHRDGAIYDSVDGWNVDTPPYYPGTGYAVDLEVQ
jgi:hypothetical protein